MDRAMSDQNLAPKEEISEREQGLQNSPKHNCIELDEFKGDRVGDTVYSGDWIIGTLIALSKANNGNWSEKLESDLCMLWDMSADKDVVTYLVENEFLKLAENILSGSRENRLNEIILGIVANMACQTTALDTIGRYEELTYTILNLLSSDDTETLMQIIRLLQAVMSDACGNQQSIWLENLKSYEFIGEALIFILKSSTNRELLMATIELFYVITCYQPTNENSFLLHQLCHSADILPAMLELLNEIIPCEQTSYSEENMRFMETWLSVLHSIIKHLKIEIEHEESIVNLNKLSNCLLRLLAPYKKSCNLVPMDETTAFCIQELLELTHWLKSNAKCIMSDVTSIVTDMIHNLNNILKDNRKSGDKYDPDDITSKLSKYLEHWMMTS